MDGRDPWKRREEKERKREGRAERKERKIGKERGREKKRTEEGTKTETETETEELKEGERARKPVGLHGVLARGLYCLPLTAKICSAAWAKNVGVFRRGVVFSFRGGESRRQQRADSDLGPCVALADRQEEKKTG